MLWQQRLSTLQGAKAALDVERLRRDTQIAQREAAEDPLTGIGNRRALTEALRAAAERFGDVAPDVGHRPWHSLLVIDLDGFKAINDVHGHVLGDEVLRAVAAALRGAARAEDVVVRLGGDEFVVLAQDADEAAGLALADRIAEAISALSVPSPGRTDHAAGQRRRPHHQRDGGPRGAARRGGPGHVPGQGRPRRRDRIRPAGGRRAARRLSCCRPGTHRWTGHAVGCTHACTTGGARRSGGTVGGAWHART